MNQQTLNLLTEIRNIFSFSHSENKTTFLLGGFAVDAANGSITRNHHDIDIMVEEADLEFWKNWFVERGFESKKYQRKSQNYCFYFEKDGIVVDVGSFYYQNDQVFDRCNFDEKPFLWPCNKTDLFYSGKLEGISVQLNGKEIEYNFQSSMESIWISKTDSKIAIFGGQLIVDFAKNSHEIQSKSKFNEADYILLERVY